MTREKILVYHKEKFKEFYERFSKEYNIISISSLLDLSSQLSEDYLNGEKLIVDISVLLKLVLVRNDILMYYEQIINHLFAQGCIEIVTEDSYVNVALETFPHHFYDKEFVTELENELLNDTEKNNDTVTKNITVYNKNNFDSFVKKKKIQSMIVLPISSIMKKNSIDYSLDIKSLNTNQEYFIDITSLIKLSDLRSDLVLSFEIMINDLALLENVEFIIDYDCIDICKKLFRYSFLEYIELKPDNNVITQSELKKIIDLTNEEIEIFFYKFEQELFGHQDFKEDFKKQIRKYKVLNKMKQNRIFSIFLCGASGIGKTEVARIIHRNLYPNCKQIKINFGNYSGKGSLWSLIGSPKGYLGSEKGGELTNKIQNSDSKVILIDEFEKADESIFSFFYELLEDGKFTDLDENEIDLNGYIIIFTSNLTEKNLLNVIPEPLFSRISMRYIFSPLTDMDKNEFIQHRSHQLISSYKENVDMELSDDIIEFLLDIEVDGINNLRDLDIKLTNKFIDIVEK